MLACARELGIDEQRLNVNGGAIALGHPLGCSGARLLTTLAWELRRRGGRYGVAALCVGVGQGLATVIEETRRASVDSLAAMAVKALASVDGAISPDRRGDASRYPTTGSTAATGCSR